MHLFYSTLFLFQLVFPPVNGPSMLMNRTEEETASNFSFACVHWTRYVNTPIDRVLPCNQGLESFSCKFYCTLYSLLKTSTLFINDSFLILIHTYVVRTPNAVCDISWGDKLFTEEREEFLTSVKVPWRGGICRSLVGLKPGFLHTRQWVNHIIEKLMFACWTEQCERLLETCAFVIRPESVLNEIKRRDLYTDIPLRLTYIQSSLFRIHILMPSCSKFTYSCPLF
jgi:hypothetical protein